MRRAAVAVGVFAGLGLSGTAASPAVAQSRVIVPIVIQAPRAPTASSASTPSLRVTTRTTSPQPGVTATRVTVGETRGFLRAVGLVPTTRTLATVPAGTPSVLVTVDRRLGPDGTGSPGRTRVTVKDVSESNRTVGGPAPLSFQRGAGPRHTTLIITSDAPIDAPIVILSP
jgi:hypothetical protein